jgi:hypothetical protein
MHGNLSYRDLELDTLYSERSRTSPKQQAHLRNREVVLNIVRACQPVSKKHIARQSGLQECTVGIIVMELIREGIVSEQRAKTSRGRPPFMISIGEKCDLSVLDLNFE